MKTNKEKAIAKCHAIAGRAKKRGSLPDINSKNKLERSDAIWLQEMREEKARYQAIDNPPLYYRKEWKGWNDFLGIDPNTPDGQMNIEQDKLDEIRIQKLEQAV